ESINPHTGLKIRSYETQSDQVIDQCLQGAADTFLNWRKTSFADRAQLLRGAAALLRERKDALAILMAQEMGKVLRDGVAEVQKCADCCDFYAENAYRFLQKQVVQSDAEESYVAYDPLGTVLAVMPWNFPFWQVFRFAAPALMAGNVGVLKHASNVSGC
ncbi:aldehyde dehydrogenase family protein, partial [Neobacillus sp. YIM B02564]|nr:aldehyde dehydrogenase family protein [Neobacillus paridis]